MNYLLALLSGILLVLLFPRFNLVWLAPLALAPLLVAVVRERRPGRRFFAGWAAGFVFWFAVCTWIQFVLEAYGGMGRWGGWGCFVLFSLAKGLHLAVFAMLAGWLMPKPWALPAVAALWIGLERTHGTFGFAWLALGNAGLNMSLPLRLAPYVGVYGLSFVFAMLSAALALVILRRPRRELIWLAPLLLLILLPRLPEAQPGTETAVVVQPDLSEANQWTPASVVTMQQRLITTSLETVLAPGQPTPKLLIWPETPGPFYFFNDPRFHEEVTQLARLARVNFLFGTVAFTANEQPLNSAAMLGPDGRLLGRYDKMFLVPFGEYVPPFFSFVNRITKEAGDFTPGQHIVVFPLDQQKLGVFICYESAFPHLVRRFVADGANLLVNISNDGYFGRTAAREQHLSLVRMRAVENRRWIIRSTNDGISVAIDPAGRITERVPLYVEAAARMKYGYVDQTTPYSRYGDWFAWSCLGISLICTALGRRTV